VAVDGDGPRLGPVFSADGWATRGRSTLPAETAAAALAATEVTTAAVDVCGRWSVETGIDLR